MLRGRIECKQDRLKVKRTAFMQTGRILCEEDGLNKNI